MHRGKGNRGGFGHRKGNLTNINEEDENALKSVDENNPVIVQFRAYASELDEKYDRAERIVKLSRDVTIMSKRIIFLLHTIDGWNEQARVLREAKEKFNHVISVLLGSIAEELKNEDPYQYLRSYRSGLEEFVEAITFYQYIENQEIQDWTKLEKAVSHLICSKRNMEETLQVHIPADEFILGLADLTGELMRKCIKNLAMGETKSCYQTCNFVKTIYKGFLSCGNLCKREINKKRHTLKQSLLKMENVCYAIAIRGSEAPKHVLASIAFTATKKHDSEQDEGYEVI